MERESIDLDRVTVEVVHGDWVDGLGGYYADDLMAIQAGARPDGLLYEGLPVTPGHRYVRSASLAVLVRLTDADGTEAWGDVVTPQYSGFAGRDPPIDPAALAPELDRAIATLVEAGPLTFAQACTAVECVTVGDQRLHTGVRYGISQALVQLAAGRAGRTPAHLLHAIAGGEATPRMIPLYAQSGEERYRNVDKMIAKRVDVMPHGLINAPEIFGIDGQSFLEYADWVRARVLDHGYAEHRPLLHFDVYGLPGRVTGNALADVATLCGRLAERCAPLRVQLEAPLYGASTSETVELLVELRERLRRGGVDVPIVADDWCNTLDDIRLFVEEGAADVVQIKMPDLGALTNAVEAARICRSGGTQIFIGGSCTETDVAARLSAQLAVAVGADQVLAKPGMGVDEGVLIVRNEMARVLLDWDPRTKLWKETGTP